jgi:hypothetical protein
MGMDKNELTDIEDSNYDALVESFIKKHLGLWEHHIIDEYANECHKEVEEDR